MPINMVRIPKGPFLYGDENESVTIAHDYFIDVYPVTNELYKRFIDSGSYRKREHWSHDGWRWKEEMEDLKRRLFPFALGPHPERYEADHPVFVDYYEAEAYAKWTGKRLPTEQEWEKAARGTEGRRYPWGKEFDKEMCNSAETGIGDTTPVMKYASGVSPYGCYDMAGNVWDWTCTWVGDEVVLRGGSYNFPPNLLRSAFSIKENPKWGEAFICGFRCAQDAP